MAVSKWFDYNGYMANKLVQVQSAEPTANWDMTKLVNTFNANGFAGADGAEKHFEAYGQYEEVAPNAFFNATEYYRAKAAEFYDKNPKTVTDLDVANIKLAFQEAGLSAWSHYEQYGNTEGVNPSNSFDTTAYMTAKLDAMKATEAGKDMTMVQLNAAFKAAGLSALEHFMIYGGAGAGEVTMKYEGKIPAEFAVPEDKQVAPDNSSSGTVFTLTASPSDVGVADVFNAPLFYNINSGTTEQTLNTGDKLTGTGADATLNATLLAGTAVPTMTGVATLNLTATGTALSDLNLINATGVKHINSVGSLSELTVSDVNALVESVGMSNTQAHMKVTFANSALSGTEDALTLKLNNVGSVKAPIVVITPTTAGSGVETINIVTSGAASHLATLTEHLGNSLSTINVAGDKALNIDALLDATVSTVDASGMTEGGSIGLKLAARTAGHKVTGSLGDDHVTITDLSSKDVVDLGAGSGDLLTVHGVEAGGTGETIAGLDTNITNVETLEIVSGRGSANTTTFDSTDVKGITGIALTNGETATTPDVFDATINNGVLTSKGGTGVSLNATATFGALTITVDGAASTADDHLTINIGDHDPASTATFGTGAITAGGIETITINVADRADHTIASVVSSSLKTVNITGGVAGSETEITAAINADVKADGFLGDLTLKGAAATLGGLTTQYVKMGAGDDTFTFSAGTPGSAPAVANPINIVTGGEGADTFVFASDNNTFKTLSTTEGFTSGNVKSAAQFDRITDLDFGGVSTNANTGNDLFKFNSTDAVARGDSTVVNDGQVVALSETTYATLFDALTAAMNAPDVSKQGGGTATSVDNAGAAASNLVGLFSWKGDIFLVGEIGTSATTSSPAYVDSQNYIVSLTGVTGTLDAWDIEVV